MESKTEANYFIPLLILVFFSWTVSAQNVIQQLHWKIDPNIQANPEQSIREILTPYACSKCFYQNDGFINTPTVSKTLDATSLEVVSAEIKNVQTKRSNSQRIENLSDQFELIRKTTYSRGKRLVTITLTPIRKNGNSTEYITSFEWDVKTKSAARYLPAKKKTDQTYSSVLSSGEFHKISIPEDGVYKINSAFLSASGIDISAIDLSKFKIYGNGGEMLPEIILKERPEDLTENRIYVYDENSNNRMDANDYILWYAKGPTTYNYLNLFESYEAIGHDFDVASYYFITWEGAAGKRISSLPSGEQLTPNVTVAQYDHLIYHESNEENHIKSGRRWWGDKMQIDRQKTFTYDVPGTKVGNNAAFRTITTARSYNGQSSSMSIRYNGSSLGNVSYSTVQGDYAYAYASGDRVSQYKIPLSSQNIELQYSYNKTLNEAAAWIDYFTLAIPRELKILDNQHIIRTDRYNYAGDVFYAFQNGTSNHQIWNVTNHLAPALQSTYEVSGQMAFVAENIEAEKQPIYAIVNTSTAPTPSYVQRIENQNLHGMNGMEYIMITHPNLVEETERLANFHRDRGIVTEVVTTDKIFNEFSSGSQDVTGIRDFIKLMYDRGMASGDTLNYVLLFGDASYDYKDITENNTNVVPIYQSYNSNRPTVSYCSDDYYAILSDTEGYWDLNSIDEDLDLYVGRLPASNVAEAKILVDKILHYHSESSRGDWMRRVTFVADDEDSNRHLNPSEDMTDSVEVESPEYSIKKIWLDAYEQVSFGSGNKYPKVNEEINKVLGSQGTLIFNYVGHGGENGMAHERILTRPEIQSWTNYDRLSFFITASCELAKIDNLEIETPGELMMLNPKGGAVGCLATTRLVYIGENTDLNKKLMERNLLYRENGKLPALGKAYLRTRNRDKNEAVNVRCFILLGDPAMSLLAPDYHVVTTAVNGKDISNNGAFSDTLKALELVTIEGEIRETPDGTAMQDFNGELFPTFYDKPSKYKTLANDPASSVKDFEEQNRFIYKGKVSVTNGKFRFQFVVPKDIAYNVGKGKLLYYAKDGLDHAGGFDTSYLVGGTADSLAADNQFDYLQLYINDQSWAFGGSTSPTPQLIAVLADSNGINTVGSGIGREMESILDKGTENEQSIILNDFYRPELNSYQKGEIQYPFEALSAGRHTLSIKVWDVYNNSAEAYTEFVVVDNEEVVLQNVLNYPNPFSTNTEFHFDHNKAGQHLTVNIVISSIAGNVVRSITQDISNAPAHCKQIVWDARDDYGDQLAPGVYMYTLSVKAEDGSTEIKTEKLYIVN